MSERVVDYRIVQADSSSELQEEVREWVRSNWQPLGAPFHRLSLTSTTTYWYQAFVQMERRV